MRPDIVPGLSFLTTSRPTTLRNAEAFRTATTTSPVLVLSRGGFCPKDRRQHEGLLQLHRELEVGYCRLVTISTDNITETNEFRSGLGTTDRYPPLMTARHNPHK
jgi:hypothetical protein